MTSASLIGVVLPGAHRWHRTGVISYAVNAGLTPILLMHKGEAFDNLPASVIVLEWPALPTEKEIGLLARQIEQYCTTWFVLPLDDYISEASALLSQYASQPLYSSNSAQIAFQKHLLRKQWNQYCKANHHLPLQAVPYALYLNNQLIKSSVDFFDNGHAFIIKPDAYSGSVGVMRAENKSGIENSVPQCAHILDNEAANPAMDGININRHVLVEGAIARKEKLGGCAEFTAHYLSFQGQHHLLGIAEKTINMDTYIETSHVFPSPHFPMDMVATLHDATTGMLNQLAAQNTISNWEFIVTPSHHLAMVEGQLRPSGDYVMDLIENACLVSPYTLLFAALKNGHLPIEHTAAKLTSMIYWPSPSMVLNKITAIHLPSDVPAGIHLHVDEEALKNSYNWKGPVSWYDRHIAVICTAANAAIALQQCKDVLEQCLLESAGTDGTVITAKLMIA